MQKTYNVYMLNYGWYNKKTNQKNEYSPAVIFKSNQTSINSEKKNSC